MNKKLEQWYKYKIEHDESWSHFWQYIKLEVSRMRKWARVIGKQGRGEK